MIHLKQRIPNRTRALRNPAILILGLGREEQLLGRTLNGFADQ